MCGVTGFWQSKVEYDAERVIRSMTDVIRHRGPDADGHWLDADAGIALGHRRLSVIDLSVHGAQPMISHSGRYVVTFNGEIYNYQDIRKSLEALSQPSAFRGTSDTEVMLAAFDQWGIIPTVERAVGMFAFAVWDREDRTLWLARDRMGEKPLYYGWMGNAFLFGSELKALQRHPAFDGEINRDALTMFMRYQYVPTPLSIFEGIYKLPAGSILVLDFDHLKELPEPTPYWSLREVVESGYRNQIHEDDAQAIEQLEALLMDSVRQQMIADVPLGAFLSGGIDSSTIVALMQKQSTRPVKTFSIGFSESSYNEAVYAKHVAEYLGTNHTEMYVTPEDSLGVIPKLPQLWDEPFGDSSQIPTFLVAQLTGQQVTVSLSGDGGDELFAGYPRYLDALKMERDVHRVPTWQVNVTRQLPQIVLSGVNFGLRKIGAIAMSDYVHLVRQISRQDQLDIIDVYRSRSLSHWRNPEELVIHGCEVPGIITNRQNWVDVDDLVTQLAYFDMAMYLPDDILVKVDRAAMGVSLETRVPLLDHRIVEFSQSLPNHMKVREGQGKWLLRQVLYRHVPQELVDRPKMGFGIPIGNWLKNELLDWAEALLDSTRLRNEGYLNPELVQTHWKQHLNGSRMWHSLIWDVLMFQSWLECQS